MLKHYFITAIRNFKNNKLIFAGSIITVFLCVLCISLLFTYVHNELTMDDFHENEKNIYLMTSLQSSGSQLTAIDASLFFDFDYKQYPEIENEVRVVKFKEGDVKFVYDESVFTPEGLIVDSTFFEIFDFNLKIGDESTILNDPHSLILTGQLAKKIFGNKDPIGESIKIISRRENIYTVKGIIEATPSNSSITFDFILPSGTSGYERSGCEFLLVNSGFNPEVFSEKIKDVGQVHDQFKNSVTGVVSFDEVYFNEFGLASKNLFSKHGDKKSVYVLFVIMGVIFVISLFNFSNLQIINVNSSIRNIGINKISGAGWKHILNQKATEIFILILLSGVLITAAYFIASPYFNSFTGVDISPEIWKIFLLNIAILFVLVMGAFIYPSIVFLRIPITSSLKNQISSDTKLVGRKVAIITQFSLSLVLLIVSIFVVKQLNLMLNKDLGFKSENIVCTKFFQRGQLGLSREDWEKAKEKEKNDFQYLTNELASQSFIKNFSRGQSPILPSKMPWKPDRSDAEYETANGLSVTPEYKNMLGLELVEGRFFEQGRDESRGPQIVINETAKKLWRIKDIFEVKILNKYWSIPMMGLEDGYEIIGVVKDFDTDHLSVKTQPLAMFYFDDKDANFLIEFEPGAEQTGIQFLKNLYNKLNPGEPFHYTFLSDDIKALYQKEKRLSTIYIVFTIIAFFISATGLFTIALYDTRKRIKEIGVRKVNGAKVSEILALLNIGFLKWVGLAFLIACPIAWYFMNRWLENFAYKTSLSWWVFVLAGILSLGIALITVSFQSWKAATRNPVEALRYE